MRHQVLFGFVHELVPLVKNGTKTLTYRLGLKYEFLQKGDRGFVEDSSTHLPFAEIEIVEVQRTTFSDLPIDRHGHERYMSKAEQREIFESFYKRAVDDAEQALIIEFRVLRLCPTNVLTL